MDIGNLILALIILSPILAGPLLVVFMAIALILKGFFTTRLDYEKQSESD